MAEVVQDWYARFVAVEQETLFELILAANYMDVKPLVTLTCRAIAMLISGKSTDEIRQTFDITDDFKRVLGYSFRINLMHNFLKNIKKSCKKYIFFILKRFLMDSNH